LSRYEALLVLEDGTTFSGTSIGASGTFVGEVVFNTAMTGYQEILTDPSYAGQLVTLTASHVGNVGINEHDEESDRPRAAGLIVRHCPRRYSSWRARGSLGDYLDRNGIPGIADLDTRALTVHLRENGAMNGCIAAGPDPDREQALEMARSCPRMAGQDLARTVTCKDSSPWTEGLLDLDSGTVGQASGGPHVVCYDFGVKHNILRLLVDAGCRVTVVPAACPIETVLELKPDGVMLSNGPGDPEPCDYAVEAITGLLDRKIPLMGICLGHQLLALAAGGKTNKMKFGHHGANHPVRDEATGRVMITSQNHGFAADAESLPEQVDVTQISLFDGSLQGLRFRDRPAYSFQGHPEASPGPHDARVLFADFVRSMGSPKG